MWIYWSRSSVMRRAVHDICVVFRLVCSLHIRTCIMMYRPMSGISFQSAMSIGVNSYWARAPHFWGPIGSPIVKPPHFSTGVFALFITTPAKNNILNFPTGWLQSIREVSWRCEYSHSLLELEICGYRNDCGRHCTAERSFSCLRRLKTFLRSSVTQKKLNHIAILHSHRDQYVNLEHICHSFVVKNELRQSTFAIFPISE